VSVEPYRLSWHDGIAEIRLSCGRANALNPMSLAAIDHALDAAQGDGARGVVVTGYDHFFSAGLDLVTLYDLAPTALDAFMREFDRVMLRVFAFPRPLVAAIGGHAIAGGCVLALAADVRVMAIGPARIGLNEVRLGLPFPASALEIARHGVSPTFLEAVLGEGELYEAPQALVRGLVQDLTSDDVVAAGHEACRRLAAAPGGSFAGIKAALRAPALERAGANADGLRQAFVDAWYAPDGRRLIGETRARLIERSRAQAGA
jgi:enoyl-CoA hydratase